ncbi:MAG: pitrilysin family protein [Candidatus Liptonbacteria bacterium]|nr:pitrilysin family protein [Candidatus Liptonbacteria bacterium]
MYNKKVFKNGLTLLTVPIPTASSIIMSVFVKAGSRYEEKRVNGISHFLEHLHFKGTKKYPTAKKLSEVIDSIGGEFNANTGKEHTQYYIRAASEQLPLIHEVLTDLVQNPLFDAKEIEREKGVIIEEINMYKDNPQIHIESLFEETMWPKSPLGWDIAGQAEVIRKMKRSDILDYRQKWYEPSNIIIAIAGKFDQQKLEDMIEKSWGKLSGSKVSSILPANDKQSGSLLSVENKASEQAHMMVGFKALDYNHKKNSALQLLSTVLGGGMSSRLFIEIRERRGLAYYVGSSLNNYLDAGNFYVRAGLKVSSAPEALELILSEVMKISRQAVSPKELKKAKEYVKGKTVLAMEDPHGTLDWYLTQIAFMKKIEMPKEAFAKIDAVTADEVQDLARQLFMKNNLTASVIGPFADKSVFEKKLRL